MFKGFGTKQTLFHGFPNLNFQMNNEAYGFSGCTFWLDAAYGLPHQTDATAVSSWIDRIRGMVFSQPTAANQPLLRTSDTNFNNYPSVDFNTAAKVLSASYNEQSIGISGNMTIAFVAKVNTIHTVNTLLDYYSSSGTRSHVHLAGSSAGIGGIGVYNNTSALLASSVEDTSTHITVITNEEIVIDGAQVATGSWSPVQSFDTIGYDTSTTSRNCRSRVAEILIYERKLSSSDCLQLSTNINNKYAIY